MSMLFRVIVADPPWENPPTGVIGYTGKKLGNGHWGSPIIDGWYKDKKTIPLHVLCSAKLPLMDNSCLFLWCPASGVPDAVALMDAWGFKYKTCFVWVKVKADGDVRPSPIGYWSYVVHEMLLFGIHGKFKRDTVAAPFQSVFMEKFTKGHGYKPDAVYEKIAGAYAGPYLELFATKRRPGWFAYGNQLDGGSDISIPEWES